MAVIELSDTHHHFAVMKLTFTLLLLMLLQLLPGIAVAQQSPDLVAAENGDRDAQFRLGEWYFARAKNDPADRQQLLEAVHWFAKAGDQNHVEGQFQAAFIYLYHEGGMEEYLQEGVSYLEKAAKNGHAQAQNGLGRMMVDLLIAEKLNSDFDASERLPSLDLKPETAKYWLEQAALEQGYMEPRFNLGWMYYNEILLSGEEARRETYRWYKDVCNSGAEGLADAVCYFTRTMDLEGIRGEMMEVLSTFGSPIHSGWEMVGAGPAGTWYGNVAAPKEFSTIPERFVLFMLKMNESGYLNANDNILMDTGIEGVMVNCLERTYLRIFFKQYLNNELKKEGDFSHVYAELDKWKAVVNGQISEMAHTVACR